MITFQVLLSRPYLLYSLKVFNVFANVFTYFFLIVINYIFIILNGYQKVKKLSEHMNETFRHNSLLNMNYSNFLAD